MQRILIVEDELDMQFILTDNLEAEGYDVTAVGTGQDGLNQAQEGGFDLIILDLMLPDTNGFEVCKRIRVQDPSTPLVMLTAKGDEIDRVVGLAVGADDYITKPFAMREFLARVMAALRRGTQQQHAALGSCRIGDAEVSFVHHEIVRDNRRDRLTRLENDLLRCLSEHRGETVSRETILERVWGVEATAGNRTVDNCIARLRSKLEPDPGRPRHIITVHGVGYTLA
jgi:DNA-binding response OmpR family regulator